MEKWPSLPTKEVTPSTSVTVQPANLGSKAQARTSMNQSVERLDQDNSTRGAVQRKLDMNTEPAKKWANFFDTNRLSAKGMSLIYVNLAMKYGELNKVEIDKATEEWKQAIILYVVGDSPTIAAIERYIAMQVNIVRKPKVYYHNGGYFLVRFASMDDRNEVLYSGPHMLNAKPI